MKCFFNRSFLSASLIVFGLSVSVRAETYTFGIVGDAGHFSETASRTAQSIARSRINQLILPGDNLYYLEEGYDKVWRPWRNLGFQFSVVALGNHTLSYADEIRYFQMPGEFYALKSRGLHFLVLNSDNPNTVSAQAAWLEAQLRAASRSELVFVVFHHAPYTISDRHSWKEKKAFHQKVRPILARYQQRIAALLVGHDHIASLVDVGGLPMVISGAVFEQIQSQPVNYLEDGVNVRTRWLFRGNPHWVRLDVDTAAKVVWFNYVDSITNQVVCSVRTFPRPMELRPNCALSTFPGTPR